MQAVGGIMGVQLGRKEALMNAGLDSLGRLLGRRVHLHIVRSEVFACSGHLVCSWSVLFCQALWSCGRS